MARLLQCLAGCTLGGLHSPQNAAVGVGSLDGPLDEPVLVDSTDDAVEGGARVRGGVAGAQISSGQHMGPTVSCWASLPEGPGLL